MTFTFAFSCVRCGAIFKRDSDEHRAFKVANCPSCGELTASAAATRVERDITRGRSTRQAQIIATNIVSINNGGDGIHITGGDVSLNGYYARGNGGDSIYVKDGSVTGDDWDVA